MLPTGAVINTRRSGPTGNVADQKPSLPEIKRIPGNIEPGAQVQQSSCRPLRSREGSST